MTSSQFSSSPGEGGNAAAIEQLGERIADLSARIQAATHDLLVLIREFDERSGWNSGFSSCAHWLNWRTGLELGAAREKVRVARALGDLPVLSEAMGRGAISYSKVRALTRVATSDNERQLLEFASAGTASHVERLVRAWRRVDRIEANRETARRHENRQLQTFVDEDGMVVIRGRLTPEVGAVVQRALEAASERLFEETRRTPAPETPAEEVSPAQRRADALGLLAEAALASDLDRGTAGDRYQVVVHVEAESLQSEVQPGADTGQAVLEDDLGYVSAETSQRIACDASTVSIAQAEDGSVLNVGRKTRTIPPAIRRALAARDQRCRFPGCAARRCDAHHVKHWADGGETNLDNLVLLCRRHHRAVHEEGFSLTVRPDGEVNVLRPNGRALEPAPASPGCDGPPLAPTNERLQAHGLAVGPDTATPLWRGEPLDEAWAIDVLRVPPPVTTASGDGSAETSASHPA